LEALFLRSQGASAGIIEQHLGTAVSFAHEQGARLLELRSATMLAQLWAEHGERQRACDLLTAVYASFTEGLNTDDLQQAAILLSQLD
jgi:predicted ATPase